MVSAPTELVLAAGQRVITATITAGTSTGTAELVAQLGSIVRAEYIVTRSVTRDPLPGDLVITEIHRNPGGSGSNEYEREWFEVYNSSPDRILIDGLEISDNSAMNVVAAPGVFIEPESYVIFANLDDTTRNGGVMPIAAYGSVSLRLANTDDELHLSLAGMNLDTVDWAANWPGSNGVTMCLKFPYGDNNDRGSWAESVGTFGTASETGHPGIASDATNCP